MLPIIDISGLRDGDPAGARTAAAQMDRACCEVGFFYVSGHGVAQETMDAIFEAARVLFALPDAEKQAISITKSRFHHGYGSIGEESLEEGLPADFKEAFDMGRHLPLEHPDVVANKPLHGPNQYPDIPGWRDLLDDHFWRMQRVGLTVMRGLAIALDLPEDFFETRFSDPVSALRLLHYPPHAKRQDEDQLGCGAHTDYGCVTILAQDEHGGLQVQQRDGGWVDATPVPGTFVVNLGDLMARWTNDRWVSTPHRVINSGGADRYSIPFFCEPNFDTRVVCLESCRSENNPPKYPETTSGAWLLSRFDDTYAYRKAG